MASSKRPFNRNRTIFESKICVDVRCYEELQEGIGAGIGLNSLNDTLHSTKNRLRPLVESTSEAIKQKVEEKLNNVHEKDKFIQESHSFSELFLCDQLDAGIGKELRKTIKNDQNMIKTLKTQLTTTKNKIKQLKKCLKIIQGFSTE